MTTETTTPKQAKGGVLATADVKLLKKILLAVLGGSTPPLSIEEEKQAANLVHRLGRIA